MSSTKEKYRSVVNIKDWIKIQSNNYLALSQNNLYGVPTRKNATCLWFLSAASCAGVRPVLSVTIKSSFFPACTKTVHASKLPLMAAQCKGVQPRWKTNIRHWRVVG